MDYLIVHSGSDIDQGGEASEGRAGCGGRGGRGSGRRQGRRVGRARRAPQPARQTKQDKSQELPKVFWFSNTGLPTKVTTVLFTSLVLSCSVSNNW